MRLPVQVDAVWEKVLNDHKIKFEKKHRAINAAKNDQILEEDLNRFSVSCMKDDGVYQVYCTVCLKPLFGWSSKND